MRPTRLTIVLALAAAAGCRRQEDPAGAAPAPAPRPAARAEEGTELEVRRGRARRETPCVGELRARRAARVGPQVSGRLLEVLVEEGAPVTAKQELARLDPAPFEIELARREADAAAAAVAKEDAELQFERMKAMWQKPPGEEPSVPRKAYDDARLRLKAAEAQVARCEVDLRRARHDLGETVLHAPFDGVVTRRFLDPGEPVTSPPATHILEIQDVARLDLEFSLPQAWLAGVGPGTPVRWDADGVPGAGGDAVVATVLPGLDEATRTFRCRVEIANDGGRLRPGLLARVRVLEDTAEEGLFVPFAAVDTAGGAAQVKVREGGRSATRAVKLGRTWGDAVEVLEGLSPGDRVVLPEAR